MVIFYPKSAIAVLLLIAATACSSETKTDRRADSSAHEQARRIIDSIQYEVTQPANGTLTRDDFSFLGTIKQNQIVLTATLNAKHELDIVVAPTASQGAPQAIFYCRMASTYNELVRQVRILDEDGKVMDSSSCN